MTIEEIQILPNPDAKRTPVVSQCLAHEFEMEETKYGKVEKVIVPMPDCDKVFNLTGHGIETAHGLNKVCIAYLDPAKMWRRGCPSASNKIQVTEKGKFVNPLKASKRGIQTGFARKRKNR